MSALCFVDTNLLVYAHREDSPWHEKALARVTELANSDSPWAIPWSCVHEFLAIVTHPKIYNPPTPLVTALSCRNRLRVSEASNLASVVFPVPGGP